MSLGLLKSQIEDIVSYGDFIERTIFLDRMLAAMSARDFISTYRIYSTLDIFYCCIELPNETRKIIVDIIRVTDDNIVVKVRIKGEQQDEFDWCKEGF